MPEELKDEQIEQMMARFAEDYDLSSMNYNDKLALEALCGLYAQIQDNMNKIKSLKESGNWGIIPEIVDLNKKLVDGIETLEKQLGISRKARGQDKESSIINFISDLQQRAKTFIEKKLNYLYCPECYMLLATVWVLYPKESNELHLTCGRCGESTIFPTENFTKDTTEVIQRREDGER